MCCQALSVKLRGGGGGILLVNVLRLIVHLEAGWDSLLQEELCHCAGEST